MNADNVYLEGFRKIARSEINRAAAELKMNEILYYGLDEMMLFLRRADLVVRDSDGTEHAKIKVGERYLGVRIKNGPGGRRWVELADLPCSEEIAGWLFTVRDETAAGDSLASAQGNPIF